MIGARMDDSSIDTRYPPQPHKMNMPLYPLQGKVLPHIRPTLFSHQREVSRLRQRIGESFGLSESNCHLGVSARHVLYYLLRFLRHKIGRDVSVAVPSFYCAYTAAEIMKSGARLILVDIDNHLGLSSDTLQNLAARRVDVLIAPDLFGVGHWNHDKMDMLRKGGTVVVHDRAHTFPVPRISEPPKSDVTLFSFGVSKPLAGSGGGGLVIKDRVLSYQFADYYQTQEVLEAPSRALAAWNIYLGAWRIKARHKGPKVAIGLGLISSLFSDQREHLEKAVHIPKGQTQDAWHPLSQTQASIALKNWGRMEGVWDEYISLRDNLLEAIEHALSPQAVHHIKEFQHTSMVALRLQPEKRHRIAQVFADNGLQTTWYYYPLHKLKAFQENPTQHFPGTVRAAGEVLIVPCHWSHKKLPHQLQLSRLRKELACV